MKMYMNVGTDSKYLAATSSLMIGKRCWQAIPVLHPLRGSLKQVIPEGYSLMR